MMAIRLGSALFAAKSLINTPRGAFSRPLLVRGFYQSRISLRKFYSSDDDEPADDIEQAIIHGFTATKVSNSLNKGAKILSAKESEEERKQTIFDTEKEMFQVRRQMTAAYSLGEYQMALGYAEQLLEMAEKLMGKRNAVYASCLNNVALMLKVMGEQEKAMEKYVAALHVYFDIAGQNNTSYASALANIGVLYKEMSKGRIIKKTDLDDAEEDLFVPIKGLEKLALLDRAEEALVEARDTRIKLLGAAHKDSLYSSMHLASLLKMQNKPAEAETMLNEALALAEEKYSKLDLICASLHNDLGVLHKSQSRFDQALVHYNQALSVRSNILGDAHNDTVVCTYNLAELYTAMGQEDKAVALQEQLVTTLESKHGKAEDADGGSGNSGNSGNSGEVVVETVKGNKSSSTGSNPKILEYTHKPNIIATTTESPPSPINATLDKPDIKAMVARDQQTYISTTEDDHEERKRKLLLQTTAERPHKPSTRRGAKKAVSRDAVV